MLTPYPQIVEYNEAVQHPASAFRDPELRRGTIKLNALGLPVALSGAFALTYAMTTGRRALAVRCFHRQIPALEHKYAAIARVVKALHSPYFVDFDYLPDGIRIRGGYYPVVKMEWAEGEPFGVWLDRNCRDPRALAGMREAFARLAAHLEKHGIAHGDIQNGNVIVSRAGLRVVDYDGVYVPGMPPEFGSETGHKHFQHPRRTPRHFGPDIDRFSFIVIDLSLAALIERPDLYRRYCRGGETILFCASDFADPERSTVLQILRQEPSLQGMTESFVAICRGDPRAVPTLDAFRASSVPPRRLAGWRSGIAEMLSPLLHPQRPQAAAARHTVRQPIAEPRQPPTGTGRANRELLADLLRTAGNDRAGAATPRRRQTVAGPQTKRQPPPGRSNRDIVQQLRGAGAAAAVAPPAGAAAPPPRPRPMARQTTTGSVVIHPRKRAGQPLRPALTSTAEEPPRLWQRVRRFLAGGV
jgi:hypothetical protein